MNDVIAISDIGVMLFVREEQSDAKFKYLFPITSAPATGGEPQTIDVTELDSLYTQFIVSREQTPTFTFDYNYTVEKYQRAKQFFDGRTIREYLLVYSDKSGVLFKGAGAVWQDTVTVGSAVKGRIAVAVSHKEHIADVSDIVDATTIPIGKANPFAEGSQIVLSPIMPKTVAVGQTITVPVYVSPADVVLTAESGDMTDATVDVEGRNLMITGVSAGEAVIKVTATKTGYVSASYKFVVTVVSE